MSTPIAASELLGPVEPDIWSTILRAATAAMKEAAFAAVPAP